MGAIALAGVLEERISLVLELFPMLASHMEQRAGTLSGGEQKMLAYVKTVQREEIRRGVAAVKHQHEVGSDLGDTFKEMVGGERALKAGGHANTMNQFAAE